MSAVLGWLTVRNEMPQQRTIADREGTGSRERERERLAKWEEVVKKKYCIRK